MRKPQETGRRAPRSHLGGCGLLAIWLAGVVARGPGGAAIAAEPPVDFTRDVRPILSAACLRCHATGSEQGRLRLDTRAGFLKGGTSGPAVVPGDSGRSVLFQRLVANDPQKRMPWLSDSLTAPQIEVVRRWIDEGAAWPDGVILAPASLPPAALRAPPKPAVAHATGARLSFNRDVRPILAANCYACHGPDRNNRQAGLRLDREEVAKAPLASGHVAIVPGAPEESALIQRVTDPDEQRRMPHVSSGKERLGPAQIATLRRWIEEGAEWQPHWSYIPPGRPPRPTVRDDRWGRNAVDAFVLAAIEGQGLRPSPEAERHQLLRRLSFDLTGLPPTPAELQSFLDDEGPGAYERQVDRLLASPRFGERMATGWLDLVRYADSVGYHSDNARVVWRYRDYVIGAFNRNLPFDRFTVEQLAGDLLPNPTREQKIASGYNRLLQTTEEGGAQPREYRAIYLADRVRNASTVWLGATLGCAQCHDHKFDPYLARDFYSFAAFFADVEEKPVGRREPNYLADEAQQAGLDAVQARIDRLTKELWATTPEGEARQRAWESSLGGKRASTFSTLEPVEATSAHGTRVLIQGNDFSIIATTATGPKPETDVYTVRFKTELRGITAFRLEALPFEELPDGGPGRGPAGAFVVSEIEVRDGGGRPLHLRNPTASTPPSGKDIPSWNPAAAIDGRLSGGGWALRAADGESHRLVLETTEPVGTGGETTFTVVIHQNEGGGRTLGRFRMSASTDAWPVRTQPGPDLTKDVLDIAAMAPERRSGEQAERIATVYRKTAPELGALRAAWRAAQLEKDALLRTIPQSLVTVARAPEPVRILARGNWQDESGPLVEPQVPRFLPQPAVTGRRLTRLDLARWLTSRENPLTARVFVNRLWKACFGQGLSRTLEDLGSQGEWPTRPELLDWLAVEFMESGWDVKHMVRTLVTSSTYRQTSRTSVELQERDPYNHLYARQARFRLDAEEVRDNALAISGLLSTRMGGPSVHPYQPKGYWSYLNFPPREWDDDPGEDQYRRGLYAWWQRTFPQPSLLAFDAPSREECVVERTRSNVPQQALVLLNDPTYLEAARVFAERIVREGGARFDDRLRWAYARALAREPRPDEARILAGLYAKHREEYEAERSAAERVVSAGLAPVARDLDVAELAGWTSVARAILNLPEAITRS